MVVSERAGRVNPIAGQEVAAGAGETGELLPTFAAQPRIAGGISTGTAVAVAAGMRAVPDAKRSVPAAAEWDFVVATFLQALRFLAMAKPHLTEHVRQLSHSIGELTGMHGAVADEYVVDLLQQADRLLFTRDPGDEVEDLEETRPGTPTALRKERDTRSGTHPVVRRDTSLRFRTGSS
jgi:hypothetical protein